MKKNLLILFLAFLIFTSAYAQTIVQIPNGKSFDFSTGTIGENVTGGDLYFLTYDSPSSQTYNPQFWFNNLGQRGGIQIGDIDTLPLNQVAIPSSGYSRAPLPLTLNYCYVIQGKLDGIFPYIIVKVIGLNDQSVNIEYIGIPGEFPPIPVLVTPQLWSTHSTGQDIQFEWRYVNNAINYEFVLSDDWQFSTTVDSYIGLDTNRILRLAQPGQYYWRVRAQTQDGWQEWSESWVIYVEDASIYIPVLLEPQNGFAEVPSTNAFLTWSWINNATSFRAEVSLDQNFSTLVYSQENLNSGIYNLNLDEGSTYYWRVKAFVNGVWSNWSEVRYFTVHTVTITTPPYKISSMDYNVQNDANTTFKGALIGDVKGDGVNRLIIGNGKGGKIEIYHYDNGSLIKDDEALIISNPADWTNVVPKTIGDINNDGINEIIVTAEGSADYQPPIFKILRWNGNGFETMYGKQDYSFYVASNSSVTINDIDGDGNNEIIMTVSGRVGVYDFVNNNLDKIWEYTQPITGRFGVGDTDGDGNKEIVASFQNPDRTFSMVVIGYNANSYQEETFFGGFNTEPGGFAVTDLNNDGYGEIITGTGWVQTYIHNMYVISYNGSGYSFVQTNRTEFGEGDAFAGDIDGDGNNEVVMFRNSGGSYVYDYENGNYIFGYVNHGGVVENGCLGDIDNDNIAEIIVPAYNVFQIVSIYNQNPALTLLQPTMGSVEVNPLSTQFSWEAYSGAANYTLEINTGSDFSNPLFTYNTISTSLVIDQPLNEYTQYWWRVKADNSLWSEPWSFFTGAIPIPKLIEPKNGFSEVPSENNFFTWTWVNNATNYRIEVSQDPEFSTLNFSQELNGTLVAGLNLTEDQTYYWRVKAFVNDSWNDWSEVRNFTVHTPQINIAAYKNSSIDYTLSASGQSRFRGSLAGDFRGDGVKRIVIGDGGTGKLLFYRYENGTLVFENDIQITTTPQLFTFIIPKAIGDVDGDGINEIIVVSANLTSDWQPNLFQILKWNGTTYSELVRIQSNDFNVFDESTVTVTNIDQTDGNEIIMPVNGLIGVYRYSQGSVNLIAQLFQNVGRYFAVGNCDNDPANEIVISEITYPEGTPVNLLVLNFDGSAVSVKAIIPGFDRPVAGVAIEDLNNDGTNEIICAIGNSLTYVFNSYILHFDGSGYVFDKIDRIEFGISQAKIGDIDGDGENEIVMFRNANGSYIVDYENGSYNLGFVDHGGVVDDGDVFDIDSDGSAEILSSWALQFQIVSIKGKTLEDRYKEAIQYISSLPNNAFKKPGIIRKAALIAELTLSYKFQKSGKFKNASQQLVENVINHLTQSGNNGKDVWVIDETARVKLLQMCEDILELLQISQTLAKEIQDNPAQENTSELIPTEYNLSQNYPNPFNPLTLINYQLPENGHVTVKVFDILGKEVANLVDENKVAGYYSIYFDGSNLASGVYLYTLSTKNYFKTMKMVLVK